MSGRLSAWAVALLCVLVGGFVCAGVAGANTLPDGRTYEQVTPKEKYGSDAYQPEVAFTTSELGGTAYSEGQKATAANSTIETIFPFQAAADGAGIAFAAAPTVGGNQNQGKGGGNEYLARRSASGWDESVLSPEGAPSTLFQAFSPDLSKAFVNSVEPLSSIAPGFGESLGFSGSYDILYTAGTAGKEYVPFFSTKPPYRSTNAFGTAGPIKASGGSNNEGYRNSHSGYLAFEGASVDDSHLLFAANDALTGASEGRPAAEGGSGAQFETENNLYDSVSGRLSLVNVLPDGTTHANAAFGGVEVLGFSKQKRNVLDRAISADGSRISWTDLSTGHIYMRENDSAPQSAVSEGRCTEPSKACTVEVSASEKTNGSDPTGVDPDGPQPALYQSASSDGSKVFFTSSEELTNEADTGPTPSIARANIDGSAADESFLPPGAQAVAVDASHLYWTSAARGTIGRAKLDGTAVEPEFITGASDPQGVAVDATHVYWTNAAGGDEGEGSIGRANLDGTGVQQGFISGASNPKGLAVDAAHIYWANPGKNAIGRANLDGSGVEQSFTSVGTPHAIAVDGTYIYWTEPLASAIGRAKLDGTERNSSFITGGSKPEGIAVDATHVYWSNSATNTVGRANLDGTGAEQSFIAGASNPLGIAVDAAHIYWANNAGDREKNLYRYEAGASEHLTDLTPGVNVEKVTGTSEDGEYVYYVTAAKELMLWHGGASIPIAAVSPVHAEVTPDGHSIAFEVTEFINQTQAHVEVYNADTDTSYCASCTAFGKLGMLPLTNNGNVYQPRWISADGSRVFFVTLEGLVPRDTNETQDVYEWKRPGSGECAESGGCVYLLSGGTSPAHSGFLDASENGNDAFIVTRASLVGGDEDDLFDVYDVGVRNPLVAPPACTGTGCQGVPNPPPIFATPSSVTFEGVGNFTAPTKESKAKPKSKKKPKHKNKKKKGSKKSKAKKSARKASGRQRSGSKGGRS